MGDVRNKCGASVGGCVLEHHAVFRLHLSPMFVPFLVSHFVTHFLNLTYSSYRSLSLQVSSDLACVLSGFTFFHLSATFVYGPAAFLPSAATLSIFLGAAFGLTATNKQVLYMSFCVGPTLV